MVASRSWTRVLALLCCVWLIAPACTLRGDVTTPTPPATADATTPTVSPTSATPEPGGSLIVAIPDEPDSLNFSLTAQRSARWVISSIEARLIRVRSDNSLEPQLLAEVPTRENGGISPDGKTYLLRFRDGLRWSDGEPLGAQDFQFTWRTLTDPSYPANDRRGWDDIVAVEVTADNREATVRLRAPSAAFVETVLAGAGASDGGFLLPAHALEDTDPADIPDSAFSGEGHVGSGPFRVIKWTPGEELVVERNEWFAGPEPRLERIVFRFVPDPRQAIAYLTTGEVDLAVDLPETALPDLAQAPEVNALITPRAGAVASYAFNLNDPEQPDEPHPIFADPAVRLAIALGFNRAGVIDSLLLGQATVAATPLDHSPWQNPEIGAYPYDPAQAARVLDAAGWVVQPDGIRRRGTVRLSFTHTTTLGEDAPAVLRRQIQEAFIADMRAIGIEVVPKNYPLVQIDGPHGVAATRRFDLIELTGDGGAGPELLIHRFASASIPTPAAPSGGNVMGYANPEVDRLLAAQARALDPGERQRLVAQVQRQVHDDVPLIPIYTHLQIDVGRSYVQGLDPGPVAGLWWNPEEWWVDRSEVTD
ncbi:MAG: peptide ABC transporter substrate-binding protein [Sphaerobacter sp.]|nr:peptide ABC transporter substrate-binding protein [Sphaerobacter sp.]